MQEVTIEKLAHGGQGLGTLPDGRKVFVWGALPGEKVHVRILKGKRSYAEAIAEEVFTQAHVALREFSMTTAGDDWHYRNKMEYSFWGDDDGLHLALHNRGSHQKTIVQGSELALPALDRAAQAMVVALSKDN